MGELPADLPPHLTPKIRAELLRLHSKRLEGISTSTECLRAAYDVFAAALKDGGFTLTEEWLRETIPSWVLQWALATGWVEPPKRNNPNYSPMHFLGDPRGRQPRQIFIPASELTFQFGECRITEGYKKSFVAYLESRILYWEAEILLAIPGDIELRVAHKIFAPNSAGPEAATITPDSRRVLIDEFLRKCNDQSHCRILRRHIWLSVGHSKGRQFEYWQAGSEKATKEDHQNFSRILAMTPSEFLALLTRKNLLP